MSNGYWVVEVTDKVGTYFASKPYGYDEARFATQEEAEDFAEEVLAHLERVSSTAEKLMMFSRSTGATVQVAFMNSLEVTE